MKDEAGEQNVIVSENAPKFSAFISYSHADAATVRKLHSQIESYRLPKGIGNIDTLNRRNGRIGRVFRDREDLSAAHDLSAAVKDALERSQVLVVACSPDAKASQWVDQEIAFFRERHPDRPILAAILRGEPDEAFPAALIEGGVEPLAADLRKEGDGWRLGFLKVVAGIAGVPLDRLVQRDSQRQVRRVMAVTGLVALVAVAMSVMTTIALQARNEARFQRDEAEQLRKNSDAFIDELLTDGRQDLQAVGRLDILEKFNNRALAFYERQGDVSDLPPDSLQMWARILHVIGEDLTIRKGEKGEEPDLDAALQYFQAAHSATEELLNRDPDNADLIYGHAQSVYWVGRVDELKNDYAAAAPIYRQYRDLGVKLSEIEPGSHRTAMERGWGELNLGILAFEQRDLAKAGVQFDDSIEWFKRALAAKVDDRKTQEALANAHAWRFDVSWGLGQYKRALEQRMLGVAITKRIAEAHPADMEAKFSVLIGKRAIWITRNRIASARPNKSEISGIISDVRTLRQLDGDNVEWRDFEERILNDYQRYFGDQ